MMTTNEIAIKLPRLHASQKVIRANLGKYSVLACGRRFGKTTLALYLASEYAIEGKTVIFTAPVYKQVKAFWRDISHALRPLATRVLEQEHYIKLVTGGALQCYSLDNADSIRSIGADFIIVDEAAFVPDLRDKWGKVLSPMLLDTDGGALFISTPRGFNDFYQLYSLANDHPNWKSFNYPTSSNPHISEKALNELVSEMTQADYQQEILATFQAEGGGVFVGIGDVIATPETWDKSRLVAGVDWGASDDYTVVSIWDASTFSEIAIERKRHASWQEIRLWLHSVLDSYGVKMVYAESNSIGAPNIELLRDFGYEIKPFAMTNSRKGSLVGKLKIAIEKRACSLLPSEYANDELRQFSSTQLKDGSYSYSAPSGGHDDTVIARMLALFGCERANLD